MMNAISLAQTGAVDAVRQQSENIVDVIMQLDLDGDGRLQPSEAPAGLNQAVSLLGDNRGEIDSLRAIVVPRYRNGD